MQPTRVITTTSRQLFLSSELPVHINRVSESYTLTQHRHEFIEINYVSEGLGFQYIEGQRIAVAKGDLFYLPLGSSHVFRPSSPERGRDGLIVYNCLFDQELAERLVLSFDGDAAVSKLLETGYPEQSWLHLKDVDGYFERAFNAMHEEFLRKEACYVPVIQSEIMRILARIVRSRELSGQEGRAEEKGAGYMVHAATYVERAIDASARRMRLEPGEPFRIAEEAGKAGLSERQYRRRFAERIGMSFIDYLHKCRIEACCERLLATPDKVGTIAQQVGYQDIAFFNRLFKEKTGLSPREYRKQQAGSLLAEASLELDLGLGDANATVGRQR
ncbi:AraC family transcriptional regulator [Paenibacillus koleovorans]|uniref:AraC family transcriptional regulator n=1 Tax=Paenibacillus koleovorans TaxID=121608 RepID=UPI000FD85192|nr:AraC family transcriptional regulator [Paenibacillus koleovorans]